jgi:hypothetical protein
MAPFRTSSLFKLALASLFLWSACAHPVAPTGGPKDETPPKVDSLRSTPNLQTNFNALNIELAFDEWVKLDDPFGQVVISPLLAKRPDIKLRGKTLHLEFDKEEQLRPNTTYVINFGTAIKDITENNVPPNLQFVFSTGDHIDSLNLSGKVLDATNGKPVEKALVMLYENLADTVVRKERPYYFARTDKEGHFKLDYLKSGTFKAFALVDANQNYLFDQKEEPIAFLDAPIVLPDTSGQMNMRLFAEEPPLLLTDRDARTYGRVKLLFNQPPDSAKVDIVGIDNKNIIKEIDKDTLSLWYDAPSGTKWEAIVNGKDSVRISTPDRAAFVKDRLLAPIAWPAQNVRKAIAQVDTSSFLFVYPIAGIDTAKVFLLEDSAKVRVSPSVFTQSGSPRRLYIAYPWKPSVPYEMLLAPGALTDIYGLKNDSLSVVYLVQTEKDFGSIKLTIKKLDSNKQYIIKLLNKKGELQQGKRILKGVAEATMAYRWLAADEYSVHIIEDANGNGEWDTGDYDAKRQPERITIEALQPLRSNWELEAEVSPKP